MQLFGSIARLLLGVFGGFLLGHVDPETAQQIANGVETAARGGVENVIGGVLTAATGAWAMYEASKREKNEKRRLELEGEAAALQRALESAERARRGTMSPIKD